MSIVFVTVIQAIIVAVANVNSRYAIAVVAGEQITETGSSFRLAVFWWLVGSITAIIVAIAVPSGRNASMVRAAETVLRARPLRTMQRIFVTVIAAIVVAVAQPVRLDADICFFAFQMVRRTRRVLRTAFVRLVRSAIVFAIVHTVAHLRLRYASSIQAGEFAINARRVCAALFVRSVFAIVLVVALPRFEYAATIVAAELVRRTRMERAIVEVFIAVITAIVVSVTGPHPRYTFAIFAQESTLVARIIFGHAHATFVHQF